MTKSLLFVSILVAICIQNSKAIASDEFIKLDTDIRTIRHFSCRPYSWGTICMKLCELFPTYCRNRKPTTTTAKPTTTKPTTTKPTTTTKSTTTTKPTTTKKPTTTTKPTTTSKPTPTTSQPCSYVTQCLTPDNCTACITCLGTRNCCPTNQIYKPPPGCTNFTCYICTPVTERPTTVPPTTSAPPETTAGTTLNSLCSQPFSCDGKVAGQYANPFNCSDIIICDNGGIPVNTKKCQKTNYKSSLCLLDVIKLKQQPCVNLCENEPPTQPPTTSPASGHLAKSRSHKIDLRLTKILS